MDIYSQRNCRQNGMTLIKVNGRELLIKRYGYANWQLLQRYPTAAACYKEAIKLTRWNRKYVKL